MRPVHGILFDLREDGVESFRHGVDVGVRRFVLEGDGFSARLLEGNRYLFRCPHFLAWTVGGRVVVRDKSSSYK